MITKDAFDDIMEKEEYLVIDGALATQLEAQGLDLNHPLWSAKVLLENPQAIQDIHREYFLAGADIVITASYQASVLGLTKHCGMNEEQAIDVIKQSVRLAKDARKEATERSTDPRPKMLIAGSVGPYGAYLSDGSEYTGSYSLSTEEYMAFHMPRVTALVEAGVDLIAFETIPCISEVEAIVEMLLNKYPDVTAWISCSLQDASHLSDGTPIVQFVSAVAPVIDQLAAVGFNCAPPERTLDAIEVLGAELVGIPGPEINMLCYPNSGEIFNAKDKTWSGNDFPRGSLEETVDEYVALGCKIVGGCCRTTYKDIKHIAEYLHLP